ncbi:co-chaperone GroES [Ehrlichia ruminantium]|uniref:Co-chaperonin GroES n=1 Tax=Ehrlichia ruminantium TaxID=779 RepID=A0AAE6Q971_EHRRU|nr:co-chaperone GroES [Ehrlichia ruminantium]QGR02703.1 co-chaperone GroES [Ehrlichia ruminantium]QGR03624.1 co-chaperone GroES [Ehrlichia ruminantium]QGR04551.1 co-chaperone GroES [Ehrlichia ruminantium]
MNLSMLHDNVLIEALEESLSNSPIQLPDSAKKKPTKGKVVAVGPGACNSNGNILPMTIKAGDVVFYRQWAGNEIEFADKKYIVMKESDIIAKEV